VTNITLAALVTCHPARLHWDQVREAMGANQVGLFVGEDVDLQEGLWVITPSTMEEVELTGIGGAAGPNSTGLFNTIAGDGPDFTQFNGLDLFEGVGADNKSSLWVTDGTAAGTRELLPNNAGVLGLLSNASGGQPGFAVLNSNQILFAGADGEGDIGLWSTDGTSAGTHHVSLDTDGILDKIEPVGDRRNGCRDNTDSRTQRGRHRILQQHADTRSIPTELHDRRWRVAVPGL
jgi:hypothetical protein